MNSTTKTLSCCRLPLPKPLNNTLPVVCWLHKDLGGQCVFASEVDVDCQAGLQWCVEKLGWLFGVVLCFVSSAFVGRINSFIIWSLPKSCKDTRRATCMGYECPTEKSVGSWWIFYDFGLLFVLWQSLDFEDVKFWDSIFCELTGRTVWTKYGASGFFVDFFQGTCDVGLLEL